MWPAVPATTTCKRRRRSRLSALRAENAALRAENASLRADLLRVTEQLAAALKRIDELEAQRKENSATSDRPPSSDPPWNKSPPKRRERTGRKQGAQPGHKGVTRGLIPTEQADHVLAVLPERCKRCKKSLPHQVGPGMTLAWRHQVTELPPQKLDVTEHQLYDVTCTCCGAVTSAELPTAVGGSAFGPRLQATVALLTGRYRLSRREAVEAMRDLYGVDMALGTISAIEKMTSAALKAPYEDARKAVRDAGVVHADETGWRNGAARAWLWIAVTTTLAVFWIDPRRTRKAFQRFLGSFANHLVTDRWGAYMKHPLRLHQLCWAHLRRDFERLTLRKGEARKLGKAALVEIKLIFALWHRFEAGEIKRPTLKKLMKPIQDRFYDLLIDGLQNSHQKANGLCARLVPLWPCLWVFLRVEGVQPTNNPGERDLRKAVLWRKGSFGSQSDSGCTYASRILTVVGSLRKQDRDILAFLEQAIRAHRTGGRAPSLLAG